MKKYWVISLAVVVIISCIFIAGCVAPTNPAAPTPSEEKEPVLTVYAEKIGTTYNPGELFALTLPSNPTTGYEWVVTNDGGLNITKEYVPANTSDLVGAGGKDVFSISSEQEGTFYLTFKYMRPWEEEESAVSLYKENIVCVETDELPLETPRCVFVFEGEVNPAAGEYVKIITPGNPTTGYTWKAS